MKRFTVVWTKDADAQLARIWMISKQRSKLQRACDQLEQMLGKSPESGTQVSDLHRTAKIDCFEILYAIIDADRIVRVIAIREI